jgi:hypothetical protein
LVDIVSLSNVALLSIGARATVSSLTEGSPESNACSVFIPIVFGNLARAAWWNCLRKQTQLTLLKAAATTPENPNGTTLPIPPSPWLYSYAVPSDSIKIRSIIPNLNTTSTTTSASTGIQSSPTWVPGSGEIPFAVAYDVDSSGNPLQVILTNLSQAMVIYTVNQQNPIIWDVAFQTAFCAQLASYLVPALSMNIQLASMKQKEAQAIIDQARIDDGNEGYTTQDHIPDWLLARGYNPGNNGLYNDGYFYDTGLNGDYGWGGTQNPY